MLVTRFAPSPNGPLHLGHAFSAVIAHDLARAAGGRFVLRVEDIDPGRTMAEIAEGYPHDLAWLGLDFEQTAAQSRRLASYEAAADRLRAMGLLYPCRCTRAAAAISARRARSGPRGLYTPAPAAGARSTRRGRHGGSTWRARSR